MATATASRPTSNRRGGLPAELRPDQVVAIIDTREQLPLDLSPLRTEAATLPTGDYSVRGLESIVAIERKGLGDLLACIGGERERFDREVQRLLGYPVCAVIVEATWPDLERGDWRSHVTPAAAVGSVLGWIAAGIPFIMGRRPRAPPVATFPDCSLPRPGDDGAKPVRWLVRSWTMICKVNFPPAQWSAFPNRKDV